MESFFVGLLTRGVSLIAMLSADTTAAEFTWKSSALFGWPSGSSAVLSQNMTSSFTCIRYLSCCGVKVLMCILFWMVVDCH